MAVHFANQGSSTFGGRRYRSRDSERAFNSWLRTTNRDRENNNGDTYKEAFIPRVSFPTPDCLKWLFRKYQKHTEIDPHHVTLEQLAKPHDCKELGCTRVVINCSGHIFETQERTLNRYPNTLMGNPKTRRKFWDEYKKCYFLDRHAPTFEAVLFYYQSGGRLNQPKEVPDDIFLKELDFYKLGLETVNEFRVRSGYIPEDNIVLPEGETKRKIWTAFEHPNSSWLAMAITIVSIATILTSILSLCLETLPDLNPGHNNNCIAIAGGSVYYFENPFFIIESICVSWFVIELCLRFASCPDKVQFVKSVMNVFDALAIAPFIVGLLIILANSDCDSERKDVSFAFLRVLRLLRVFRVFRLSKHSTGLKILILTIERSRREIVLFFFFLSVCVILFAGAIYYAEVHYMDTKIISIPEGFWWTIITMTTVGYGDVYPTTLIGKLIGSMCVIAGVLTVALLVPIVVTNFNNFYIHQSEKAMVSSRREKNYAEIRHEKKRIYKWAFEQQNTPRDSEPRSSNISPRETSPRVSEGLIRDNGV